MQRTVTCNPKIWLLDTAENSSLQFDSEDYTEYSCQTSPISDRHCGKTTTVKKIQFISLEREKHKECHFMISKSLFCLLCDAAITKSKWYTLGSKRR
jgi:hypothetical protein